MEQIYLVPRTLGIRKTQKGYHYLIASIHMALEDEKNLIQFTKTMFGKLALEYDTDPSNIERNIRTLIDQCWSSAYKVELQKIAPYRLDKKPTVGAFIDILYWQVKCLENQKLSDSSCISTTFWLE